MPALKVRARPGAWLAVACTSSIMCASAHAQTHAQSADGEWPMAARDYANASYSALDQVNAANAAKLKVAFTFSTGVDKGQEAAPQKWKFEPNPNAHAQGVRHARSQVGPSLKDIRKACYVAGVRPNSADNLEK